MHYKLHISESAEKALKKIPRKDREKILEKIESLEIDPRPNGYIKLKGTTKANLYRIRYGDYRIIYTVEDDQFIILVIEIGNRKEIYR